MTTTTEVNEEFRLLTDEQIESLVKEVGANELYRQLSELGWDDDAEMVWEYEN